MKAKVIFNPYAGRWLALKRKDEVVTALRNAGIEFDLVFTERPGHATELAVRALQSDYSLIIAAGGDGTISEVVNGLVRGSADTGSSSESVPLGIIPLGSANDLVDNLGLPKELSSAAHLIATGKTIRMDLCQVNGRCFDNNAAVGLEPFITLIQQRIVRLRGVLRYLTATLLGIQANPSWSMHLEWEGGEYDGPITLVTVGNHRRTGGMFYVTPHANAFDGLLTFVYGYLPTRRQILKLLPRTMRPGAGNYVEHPDIHEVHSPWLRIHSETPTPLHADGEIQSETIQDLEFSLLPVQLSVIST